MHENIRVELEKLRAALAGLEAQRAILSEAIIAPALQSLSEKISALEAQSRESQSAEERRILTVLFADIVGSTSIAEKLDPEEYRELVVAIHEMSSKAVLQHRGVVLQYLGDGLLAVFGSQETNEQDPENAVKAALEIQRGCASLKSEPQVQMRVGVHTGLVLVSQLSISTRKELTALGDAMNLAARLQSAALPGSVLISHDTYSHVRNLFDVTRQPLLQVKGKSEPVQTYLVHRSRPPLFRNVTRGVAGIETSMIGREKEVEHLHHLYQEVKEQNSLRWVQILGSPGIGKSRLVAEMVNFIEPDIENLWLLKARAFQGDEKQAYTLVRHFWFNRFQIAEDIPLAEAESRWVQSIHELAPVGRSGFTDPGLYDEEAAHALGLLLGLPFTNSPYLVGRRQDPAQIKGRAYVVSRSFLNALRSMHPVVILLEDLHWCDGASWDYLLEVLLEESGSINDPKDAHAPLHGLLILATARPEWNPPPGLLSNTAYHPIELKRLSQEDCQALVTSLLRGVENVPDDVPSLLIERSEGVPYFIEELFNWLLDRGVIDQQRQPWRFLPERWHDALLPQTLQHLLQARLGSIPLPEQAAIKRGAIFGRNFWEEGIEAMEIIDSHTLLTRSQARGFVLPQPDSTFDGEHEWGFYHNLLREAAYESLLRRERRTLHQVAGAWLESQARQANRLDEFAGLLAEHYDLAGLEEKASHWYLLAGQRAKDRFALREARRLIDRAMELMAPTDQEAHWQALLQRSGILGMLGEMEGWQADLDQLLTLASASKNEPWLAEVHHRQGHYLASIGDYRGSIQAYEQALLAARRSGDQSVEAFISSLMIASLTRLGEMGAAAQAADKAIGLVHSLQDETIQAMIFTNVSIYYGVVGDHARAIEMLEKQIEITHRLSNLYGESIGLLNLGYEYLTLGMFAACSEKMEQSLQRSDAIGARQKSAFTRLNLSLAYWRQGRLPEAQGVLQVASQELAGVNDPFGQAVAHTYQGLILELKRQFELAMQEFSIASQALLEMGMPGFRSDAVAGMARCALHLGRLEEARQNALDAWERLSQGSESGMELPLLAYLTCYHVFEHLGETGLALAILEKSLQYLNSQTDRINNSDWKRSFLEDIPEHRELLQVWQAHRDQFQNPISTGD